MSADATGVGERLLTPQDLSRQLSVPVGTLYRWNYMGTGPTAIKVGRHLRYRPADVTAWLDDLAEDRAG